MDDFELGIIIIKAVRDEMYALAIASNKCEDADVFHDAGDALADAIDLIRGDDQ